MSEWNLGMWLVVTECMKMCFVFCSLESWFIESTKVAPEQAHGRCGGCMHRKCGWIQGRGSLVSVVRAELMVLREELLPVFVPCNLSCQFCWHSLGVFCSLLSRLQEDTAQRPGMDFWVLPRRRSSATAKPLCMKCCRRRGAGAEWAWTSQLCSPWGSKTSEKRQMPILWMSLKKTGKENGAVQWKTL